MLKKQRQRFTSGRLIGYILSLLFGLIFLISSDSAFASIAPEPPIPTTAIEWEQQYARIPDWSQITFRTLPPVSSGGSFSAPPEASEAIGYDLSREWQAGQTTDTYLKLGDFQTSLYPQIFNLHTIADLKGLDLRQVALSSLEMADWQTVNDLTTAIPGLSNLPVRQVGPIAKLWSDATLGQNLDLSDSIGDALTALPELGQLNLGQLGDRLINFAITDIPGLENIPLQNLQDWENSTISGVPGLSDVPLAQMPNPIEAVGSLGRVDVVYGPAEQDRTNTISGSNQVGFEAACQTDCAHAELTASPTLHGKQWISGKYQEVEGGEGFLKVVNGGKEPTGRHPFGDVFKVAVWDTDEASGTISTALFFRICQRGGLVSPDLGCTPYFLGPVPFLNYQEKSFMLVGPLDDRGGASQPESVPTGVMEKARAMGIPISALPGGDSFIGGFGLCGEGPGGVDFSALAAAFSSIEGNYGSVGSYVCDGDGNCGRGLGRYQYMSYRSDVRASLRQQSGGVALLSKLDSGAAISQPELERAFPAAAQDNIFKADQGRNIQQAQREGFFGKRLIERAGQIHFGGPAAPIDGGASDVHGRLTLKTYGEELAQQYETAVAAGTGKRCEPSNALGKELPAGEANQRIYQSMGRLGSFDSSMGPDGGNLACAWAVNRVLADAGIQPLGSNPNYVPSVEADLQGGRGTQVNQTQAQAGDIVIAGSQAHIGICLNQGCSRVRSNSSSRARFTWESNSNFDGFYGRASSRIYRLKP
ncbi:hypothetical protein [Leptolyngbya sp. BC1307]|uniref:hypothetical protein n=1 Tax=Leptolyngbya sp. BC1307 TaxID=2029589 RepID=UPI000EFD05BE|nr:hypothetical protein [Leptolyngbya sp. BC1307]